MIRFHPLAAGAASYPKPHRSPLPLIGECVQSGTDAPFDVADLRLRGEYCWTFSGRGAIYHALKQLGLKPGDTVALPSYHCASLVAPVVELGFKPLFYHLKPDLTPNMDDLAIKARLAKALLFINYFGFPQKAEDILDIASNFKLPIIEDCAHSYLIGNPKVSSIGRFSDYIIGSTRKFVPGIDGGILVSTSNALKLSLQKQSFFDEIKNIVNLYQRASEYSRGGLPGVLLDSLERLRKRTRTTPPEPMIASKRNLPPADWLGANDREKSISLNSRFQISRAKPSWIAQRRRNIFNRYLKELQGLRAKPLLPMLPDTVIPYVFPLLLDEPAPDFHNLKMAGVPIYRWEEIALTDCPVATDYRLRLIQLPCHQSLTDEDLEWILEQLQTFLS